MRRISIGLFILTSILLISSLVYATPVNIETAKQVANNWYSERNDKSSNDFKIVESFIETENAENIYYIFNFDKTGFVIVSADDDAVPILGYVFKHNYTTENHPPQFDAMLASYKDQILYIKKNNYVPSQETVNEWNRLKVLNDVFVPENYRAVGPLLSTTWNQGTFYNESCPADPASNPGNPGTPGNGYVWAGCTATATAQVMKYHAHPITGEGTYSYTDATYGPQFVNYGATTYIWATMPNNVTAVTPSVHTLLYHVGVGAEMGYGIYGSGAWIGGAHPATALSALQNHFKYDPNSYYDQRNNYSATPSVWHTMLKTELDNNRPLVYEGYNSGYSDGHAFVIDGYQGVSNDDYHVNWGWSGSYDGYFTLDALAPLLPNYDYRFYQAALFGVEPRKWRPLPDVSIDISQMDYTGVDLDNYYEGPALIGYSVATDLSSEEFALTINANNELVFSENPTVTSDVNIDITIRATYTGGTADDIFNFIITGTGGSGSTVKWEQLPDLSPTGMDVDATNQPDNPPPLLLADDFECTETGYITDIHIWGSWINDHIPFYEDPAAVQFTFSIHADIPASQSSTGYSMPGDILWMRTWIPTYEDVEWIDSGPEDWYNPLALMWLDDNHLMCYKYNYVLDPQDYFLQEGTPDEPIIYWLDVQAQPMDINPDCRFGWKTSVDHWNDDAVWIDAIESYVGPWNELRYPAGHEYFSDSIDLAFQITTEGEPTNEYDFGDAPEGSSAIAYPSTGVAGAFPTCITVGAAGSYVQHGFGENWAWFGPMVDLETDGNAGLCPGCFPTYDDDECFNDGDAGLIMPDSYTIDATGSVTTCPSSTAGSSLGIICNNAIWGTDIEINVTNNMPVDGYVNVLVDWNQDGQWQNDPLTMCAGVVTPEHVLVDFVIPAGHSGLLSTMMAIGSTFQIGPNSGYVWVRFSITESPVGIDWDGSGVFEDGETEDYLLYVEGEPEELDFGDAPDDSLVPIYPTLIVNDGARHIIDGITYMGALIDPELDGLQSPDALGDDWNNLDDEDGVIFTCPLIPGEQGAITVTTNSAGIAYFNSWIDFNADGDWSDANEQIFTDLPLSAGIKPLNFNVPIGATIDSTYARFRFCTVAGIADTGYAPDGEVEDYRIKIAEIPDDDCKMHYHQWPDTTMFGVDVHVTYDYELDRILADDFLCTETGLINSIHIWGSWKSDCPPPPSFASFQLGIWSDNPSGPNGWSEPATFLWEKMFFPGDYLEEPYYYVPDGEHWYDPCTGYLGFPGDYTVWKYDFTIPNVDAFTQVEGNTYWLSVKAIPEIPDTQFGWKSSVNHWNDDAVYQCNYPTDPWTELIYPPGHPFNPNGEEHVSMDMAFYIDCEPTTPIVNISVSSDTVYVTWNPIPCANTYTVYSSTDPYATFPTAWTLEQAGITTTSWCENVSVPLKKFYKVVAVK